MATLHDYPAKVNSANVIAGDILITSILKGVTITVDNNNPITFAGPISFNSPIACSGFRAAPGTVCFIDEAQMAPWSPLRIRHSLLAWYDFSDASTVTYTAGEGGVTAVEDKAPTGFNTSKTISYDLDGAKDDGDGVKPTYGASTLNGLNLMDFTNKSYLERPAEDMKVYGEGSTDGNLLVVFVARLNAYTSMPASSLVSMAKGAGGDWQLQSGHPMGAAKAFEGNLSGLGSTSATDGEHPDWSVWSVLIDEEGQMGPAETKYLYNNGVLLGGSSTAASKMADNQQFRINRARGAAWPKSSHGEMIVATSIECREVAEAYLAYKWGLTDSLPPSHPYKNTPPRI